MTTTTLASFPVATALSLSADYVIVAQWNGSGYTDKRITPQNLYNGFPAITLTPGTLNTGAAGTQVAASITGTAPNFTLNLTIPQGQPGTSGTGTGNLNTSGSVTAGAIAVYTDTSGNYISAGVPSTVRTTLGLGGAATLSVGTTTGTVAAGDDSRITGAAPAASPTFTGTVTIPTPSPGDNSTKAASTAFVAANYAPLASPTFTGTVTVPTPVGGDNSTKAASTAFVAASYAPLASPTLTGSPTAPTQSAGDNSTKIATTAYVAANAASASTAAFNFCAGITF